MFLVDYAQMLNMASVTLPVEIYSDTTVHVQSVHDSYTQYLAGLLMVQVRKNAYRPQRRKTTVNNLVKQYPFILRKALNTDVVQHQQVYPSDIFKHRYTAVNFGSKSGYFSLTNN